MKRISIFAGLLLSIGSQELPAVTLRDTVGARQERATQDLIEASAGKDSADVYRSLKRSDRGDFLRRFWEARNPLLYRYYYAAYVSEGRIVVSHSFFDRGELYPRVYQSGLDQWPDSTIAKAENSIDSIARSDPADIAALTALGYLRLERDAFSEADDWFIRALRLNRRHGAAIVGRGLVGLRKHRQIPRAIRLFQRALATKAVAGRCPGRRSQVAGPPHRRRARAPLAHERAHRLTQALAAYRTQIAVNPNHQQLEMTHLVLATDVTETMHDHASRLIQRSSYGVFSTPDQVFDIGQPVFLYYELYNLTRDPFGRTHYRLTYRVRRVDSIVPLDEPGRMRTRSGSVVDVSYRRLSGKGSGEEDTQFSYEHEGDSASESVYIALSEIAPPQPDVFQIKVTVTDLNADGRAVSSQIGFGME